jgi:hypothetical protein
MKFHPHYSTNLLRISANAGYPNMVEPSLAQQNTLNVTQRIV